MKTTVGVGGPVPDAASCPCCALQADRPREDIGACLGIALVTVRGSEAVRASLCTAHRRIARVFMERLRAPMAAGAER